MSRFLAIALVGFVALAGHGLVSPERPAQAAAQENPLTIQQRFFDALNRGDVAGLLTLVTNDFYVQDNAGCPTRCPGAAQLQFYVTIGLSVTAQSSQVTGTAVTSRIVAESPYFSTLAPTVTRILAQTRLLITDDKVASLEFAIDLTDDQSAELAAALSGTREAQSAASGILGVQRQFLDALNSGNISELLALTTPDFFVQGNAVCFSPCPGGPELQFFVTIGLRVSVLVTAVSGNAAIGDVVAESPQFSRLVPGLDRVLAEIRLDISDGRVSALRITLDVSDPRSAALAEALRERRTADPPAVGAPVGQAPSTPAGAAPAAGATGTRLPITGSAGILGQDEREGWSPGRGRVLLGATFLVFGAAILWLKRPLRARRR